MPETTTALTYDEWMVKVDKAVEVVAYVSVYDLPDFPSRDMFDDGATPEEAAHEALESAGYPF